MGSREGIFSVRDRGGGSLARAVAVPNADSGIRTVSRQRVSFWNDASLSRSWARDRPPHYADRLRSKDLVRACLDNLESLDSLDSRLDS